MNCDQRYYRICTILVQLLCHPVYKAVGRLTIRRSLQYVDMGQGSIDNTMLTRTTCRVSFSLR